MILPGLNYLKGQPPVLARPDADYPPWLWELTKKVKKPLPDEDGSKVERTKRRKERKQRIKEQNFLKTQ